jgi:hypothetical protein
MKAIPFGNDVADDIPYCSGDNMQRLVALFLYIIVTVRSFSESTVLPLYIS